MPASAIVDYLHIFIVFALVDLARLRGDVQEILRDLLRRRGLAAGGALPYKLHELRQVHRTCLRVDLDVAELRHLLPAPRLSCIIIQTVRRVKTLQEVIERAFHRFVRSLGKLRAGAVRLRELLKAKAAPDAGQGTPLLAELRRPLRGDRRVLSLPEGFTLRRLLRLLSGERKHGGNLLFLDAGTDLLRHGGTPDRIAEAPVERRDRRLISLTEMQARELVERVAQNRIVQRQSVDVVRGERLTAPRLVNDRRLLLRGVETLLARVNVGGRRGVQNSRSLLHRVGDDALQFLRRPPRRDLVLRLLRGLHQRLAAAHDKGQHHAADESVRDFLCGRSVRIRVPGDPFDHRIAEFGNDFLQTFADLIRYPFRDPTAGGLEERLQRLVLTDLLGDQLDELGHVPFLLWGVFNGRTAEQLVREILQKTRADGVGQRLLAVRTLVRRPDVRAARAAGGNERVAGTCEQFVSEACAYACYPGCSGLHGARAEARFRRNKLCAHARAAPCSKPGERAGKQHVAARSGALHDLSADIPTALVHSLSKVGCDFLMLFCIVPHLGTHGGTVSLVTREQIHQTGKGISDRLIRCGQDTENIPPRLVTAAGQKALCEVTDVSAELGKFLLRRQLTTDGTDIRHKGAAAALKFLLLLSKRGELDVLVVVARIPRHIPCLLRTHVLEFLCDCVKLLPLALCPVFVELVQLTVRIGQLVLDLALACFIRRGAGILLLEVPLQVILLCLQFRRASAALRLFHQSGLPRRGGGGSKLDRLRLRHIPEALVLHPLRRSLRREISGSVALPVQVRHRDVPVRRRLRRRIRRDRSQRRQGLVSRGINTQRAPLFPLLSRIYIDKRNTHVVSRPFLVK